MACVFKERIHHADEYVLGVRWELDCKVISKSLQWPCSIHSISISLSSEIFFFHNYHQLMTTNHYNTPEENHLWEWVLGYLKMGISIDYLIIPEPLTSSITAAYSPTVLWWLNSRGGKEPCCGRMNYIHIFMALWTC